MLKNNITEMTFVGRPFFESMMDEQKSFTQVNLQMENDATFKKFLKDNQLENKRSSMVVFGPENFMYWYGVLAPADVEIPNGLMQYKLPEAEIAQQESDGQITAFNLPLNLIIPQFLDDLAKAGIAVYENPGDSDTPYLIQDLNLATKKLAKIMYLKASK